MRATIEELGGEIRFETRVTDMEIDNGQMRALHLSSGERLEADHVVLAVGHSARDTFQMLYDRGVHVEAKPFSIGFRIEHPQSLIDRCRFGRTPATRYSARPTTSWSTTAPTAARSTASACAPAAPWWRPRPSRAASSPTA
jgi:uncharacterized FAD-dependent dehydrogenase